MAARKSAPMPLDILRGKVRKADADILALKAAVQDLTSRMAKVEVAVGSGERVEYVAKETRSEEDAELDEGDEQGGD